MLSLLPATKLSAVTSEEFRNDSIMVTLELTVENSVVTVELQTLDIPNLDPRHTLISLSYNTAYSVSTAATLCGHNASHIIELYHGKSCHFF